MKFKDCKQMSSHTGWMDLNELKGLTKWNQLAQLPEVALLTGMIFSTRSRKKNNYG